MDQLSFSEAEYSGKRKQTRREKFLAEMEQVVPWRRLERLIEPHYPKAGNGRQPYPLSAMLRIYCLQQWYGLSDPAAEDALYEITSIRRFAQLSLSRGNITDESAILQFRHLLEKHNLTEALFSEVSADLQEKGLLLRQGILVDTTIIDAPSSTKNKERKRDPEMSQTRKGNQWYFGMKAHISVDLENGLVHSVTGTAANVSDISETHNLLHGDEEIAFADAGYTGIEKREEMKDCNAEWHVAMKRGLRKKLKESGSELGEANEAVEKAKAGIRAFVEHPFRVIKRQFGHRKTRYRGLKKNTAQLHMLFALANLYMARRELLST
ncbi:MAG: IS5 family transposase [Candidatus Sedimenticola sp. (ex Thyasira tokunagai)]